MTGTIKEKNTPLEIIKLDNHTDKNQYQGQPIKIRTDKSNYFPFLSQSSYMPRSIKYPEKLFIISKNLYKSIHIYIY